MVYKKAIQLFFVVLCKLLAAFTLIYFTVSLSNTALANSDLIFGVTAEVNQITKLVTIKGNTNIGAGRLLTMIIYKPGELTNDNIIEFQDTVSGQDGSFQFRYQLHDSTIIKNQDYTVKIGGTGIDKQQQVTLTFRYYDEETAKQMALLEFNSATEPEQIHNALLRHSDLLDINLDDDFEALLNKEFVYIKMIRTYQDVNEIKQIFNRTLVIAVVNEAKWWEMENVFRKYNHILNMPLDGEYKNLTEVQKNNLHKEFDKQTFDDISEISSFFDKQIREATKRSNTSGATDRSTVRMNAPISNVTQPVTPDLQQEPLVRFEDLIHAEWARESINKLADRGIVSGMGDGKFYPNSYLTREQFVKMIMLAFEFPISEDDTDFYDVDKSEWYYSYVSGASKAGIVNGVSERTFGIGNEINRQDMAVIIYRVIKAKNLKLPATYARVAFEDEAEIASYAMEAIYDLQQAGLISGMDNGRFAPNQPATRAMAAKVICNLIEQLEM